LKEKLHPLAIVGGVLIFVSTLIITIIDYRIDKRKAEEEVACSVSEKV